FEVVMLRFAGRLDRAAQGCLAGGQFGCSLSHRWGKMLRAARGPPSRRSVIAGLGATQIMFFGGSAAAKELIGPFGDVEGPARRSGTIEGFGSPRAKDRVGEGL